MQIEYLLCPTNGIDRETYSYYDYDGRGRLSNITYPDGRSLSFSWNSRDKLAQLTATQGATETITIFSYDGMNRIIGYTKTITEVGMPPQSEIWNFFYGPTGIDKATRVENGIQNLTIDYTTDMSERILSMRYDENVQGGYQGELFYTFDSFGNTAELTDSQGNVVVGYLYDLNNGAIKNEYNPYGINNPFLNYGEYLMINISDLLTVGGCDCFHDKITGGGDTYGGKSIADEWKSRYDNLKDAGCAELCNEYLSWKITWNYHVNVAIENVGNKDYRDYNPFNVDAWREETKDWDCPGTCHSNSRFEARMLQIIDCLLDKKSCNCMVKEF